MRLQIGLNSHSSQPIFGGVEISDKSAGQSFNVAAARAIVLGLAISITTGILLFAWKATMRRTEHSQADHLDLTKCGGTYVYVRI